jgi:hypothetical protein
LTFTIPLFHERPTQSNLKQRDGLKKKTKGIFMENSLLKWPLQSFFDLFNDVTKTESIKSNSSWFYLVLGNNHLKQIMYNRKTEFYDGLEDKHINQGAESTLCFLRLD